LKRDPKPVLDADLTIGAFAVGYVRVAALPQTDPRSGLDAQVATILAFAEAAGVDILSVFEDAGESAHNARRPGLVALLAAVNAGHVHMIIVPNLTRLAREAGDLHRLVALLVRQRVTLVCVQDQRLAEVRE
jgi:DNA invertase Pin-like site-specific DNA recombinase